MTALRYVRLYNEADCSIERDGNATTRITGKERSGVSNCTSLIREQQMGQGISSRHTETWVNFSFPVFQFLDLLNYAEWMSHHISYGLFFSDRQVLDDYDTELTVLCGIMIQNLPLESAWHIRGARRIGLSGKDLETTQECVSLGNCLFSGHDIDPI